MYWSLLFLHGFSKVLKADYCETHSNHWNRCVQTSLNCQVTNLVLCSTRRKISVSLHIVQRRCILSITECLNPSSQNAPTGKKSIGSVFLPETSCKQHARGFVIVKSFWDGSTKNLFYKTNGESRREANRRWYSQSMKYGTVFFGEKKFQIVISFPGTG